MSESSNIIHEDTMQWTEASQGKFRYRRKSFTRALGAKMLGLSLYEVPPGVGNAHRLVNSSDKPLKYICVSTAVPQDVIIYPDSNKIGVFGGAISGGPDRRPTWMFKRSADVGYFEGEPDA